MSTGLFFHHISLVALEDAKVADLSRGPTLALLSAAAQDRASVFALFGGQANEVYFNELQSLYDIYTPYLTPLTPPPPITDEILKSLESAWEATSFYAYGSDVSSWLADTKPRRDLQSHILPQFPPPSLLSA
jgi:fatty acid synthase subunit alpha